MLLFEYLLYRRWIAAHRPVLIQKPDSFPECLTSLVFILIQKKELQNTLTFCSNDTTLYMIFSKFYTLLEKRHPKNFSRSKTKISYLNFMLKTIEKQRQYEGYVAWSAFVWEKKSLTYRGEICATSVTVLLISLS